MDGATLANLLTTEPHPRNRTLADAMKRIGVVERSGRGVDKIYRGMLRFGHPEPDYRRTDATSVILRLATTDADEAFLKRVVEEEGRRQCFADRQPDLPGGAAWPEAPDDRRTGHPYPAQAKRTLEALVEAGLAQPHGTTRGRTYTLAAGVYPAKEARLLTRGSWVLAISSMSSWYCAMRASMAQFDAPK